MGNARIEIRRSPIGEGSGGSAGGSGLPIQQPGPGVTPKPPNAFNPPGTVGSAAPVAPAAPVSGVAGAAEPPKPKIQAFNQALGGKRHAENWKRKTNLTGQGATHVRSFHCKLNPESLEYMDQQINEWLDNHPDYEVKMVTSAVGEWTGKIKEPAMIVSVWV